MDPSDREEQVSSADLKMIEAAAKRLIEHFDSVQIFATRHEPQFDGTLSYNHGEGNIHARVGHITEWLERQRERSREKVRREQNEDDE